MLGYEERQFLYWLGARSEGRTIIDLGTFLGASAACIADGAQAAGSDSRVISYDLFLYGPWCEPYKSRMDGFNGKDVFSWVENALSPWGDRIGLVKRDITTQRWIGNEVEALFVDFTQNWDHHNHVCRHFLPHLKVGGILAHQDYVHVLCYWLHIFMERFADHFEVLSRRIEYSTAAWILRDRLPPEAFEPLNKQMTVPEMMDLLASSITRYDGVWRALIELSRVRFILHAYGVDAARAELKVWQDRNGMHESAQPHFEVLKQEIEDWPPTGDPYAGYFMTR